MSYNQFVYDMPQEKGDPPKLLAGCVVHFRPLQNWRGEFGFDWVRVGDTGMFGDEHYAEIMGKYKTKEGEICNDKEEWEKFTYKVMEKGKEVEKIKTCTFKNSAEEKDTTNYEQMIKEYFPNRFTIPWKLPDPKKTPKTGMKGEKGKTDYTYFVPVMTIRETVTNTLELHVEIEKDKNKDKPKRIIIRQHEGFSEGTGHFDFTFPDTKNPLRPDNGKYKIGIRCVPTCAFNIVQLIEAVAVYDNPNGGEIEKICGMLRVLPNLIIPKVKIMIVLVEIDIGNGKKTGQKLPGEIEELRKVLRQSYIEIEDLKDDVKVTVENEGKFQLSKTENKIYYFTDTKFLYSAIESALVNKFKKVFEEENKDKEFKTEADKEFEAENYFYNHYHDYKILCVIDEECKTVSQTVSQTKTKNTHGERRNNYVLLFKGRDMATVSHETLHILNLDHSFVSKYGVKAAPNALYTYKALSTENVMDYTKDKGFSTWFWQWKILWKELNVEIEDVPEESLDSILKNN